MRETIAELKDPLRVHPLAQDMHLAQELEHVVEKLSTPHRDLALSVCRYLCHACLI